MRVVVATDTIGALSSADAGVALARAFARQGAQVAVVPMGEAGAGFVDACAGLWRAPVAETDGVRIARAAGRTAIEPLGPGQPASGFDVGASSALLARGWGHEPPPDTVYVDLTGHGAHDGGAGLLGALGAVADVPLTAGVAALSGISRLNLGEARARLADTRLVGVVPHEERDLPLLGLRGITARRGHQAGLDPALLLATDEALAALAASATAARGDEHPLGEVPGAGACGGAGLAILALGGEITSGPDGVAEQAGLEQTLAQADLVVTGCTQLDFGTAGGAVVRRVTELASDAMRPVVAVALSNHISPRELRSQGIEQAYSLAPHADPASVDSAALETGMASVARQWVWSTGATVDVSLSKHHLH